MEFLGEVIIAVCGVILVEWIISVFGFSERAVLNTLGMLFIVGGIFRESFSTIIIGFIIILLSYLIYSDWGNKKSKASKKLAERRKKINRNIVGAMAVLVIAILIKEMIIK